MKQIILAIEDFADQALWLNTVLGKGYDLRIVQNLVQARRELLSYTPALILLDGSLPDGDGFTFCKWLKMDKRYENVPIFLFTARLEEEEREFGLSQGAAEYLVKPVPVVELKEKLAKYIGPPSA
ncbi:MAG: response regulator [Proteobacteria bacterium]|nr:MAG: response regulator [Pseudomonadota bacterium]